MPDSLDVASISKVGRAATEEADALLATDAAADVEGELEAGDEAGGEEVAAWLGLALPPVPLEQAVSAIARTAAKTSIR